jgi:hypothetical protein
MSEPPSTESDQLRALQEFEGDPDLAALETLVGRFNIFEALGVARAELSHSRFLGFLLNPKENHGLGDCFLKRFLQTALEYPPKVQPLAPLEIDLLDLSGTDILFEHDKIDVLIRDVQNQISVIVENKVYFTQHSGQLANYYQRESARYPRRRVFGIYLTIDGDEPENDNYAPISHSAVRKLITEFLNSDRRIDPEVQSALKHYADVIGRRFMPDEQIDSLCGKLYRNHKQAIGLIVKYPRARRRRVCEILKDLVRDEGAWCLDDCTENCVRFIPRSIDLDYFKCGSQRARIILFEFKIDDSILLFIQMGPGEAAVRKDIHDFALENKKTFPFEPDLKSDWPVLLKLRIVERLDDFPDPAHLLQEIESKWQEFMENKLPSIVEAFLAHWPPA